VSKSNSSFKFTAAFLILFLLEAFVVSELGAIYANITEISLLPRPCGKSFLRRESGVRMRTMPMRNQRRKYRSAKSSLVLSN